jgi:hypothetical protein
MNKHEIVRRALDSKVVDFNAIGKLVAEIGPSLAMADEPWETFCGTMRTFIHLYRLPQGNSPLENLGKLAEVGQELR